MASTCINERCRLILSSFPELAISKPRNWRKRLFSKPAPAGWKPKPREYVYLRPGITIGGLHTDRALVTDVLRDMVDVRVQNIRRWKSRIVKIEDVRPIEGAA